MLLSCETTTIISPLPPSLPLVLCLPQARITTDSTDTLTHTIISVCYVTVTTAPIPPPPTTPAHHSPSYPPSAPPTPHLLPSRLQQAAVSKTGLITTTVLDPVPSTGAGLRRSATADSRLELVSSASSLELGTSGFSSWCMGSESLVASRVASPDSPWVCRRACESEGASACDRME